MSAYSQPMTSAGQMSHDHGLTNQQSVNGVSGAPEYIEPAAADYSTSVEGYYSTETYVTVSDVVDNDGATTDVIGDEDVAADTLITVRYHDTDIGTWMNISR